MSRIAAGAERPRNDMASGKGRQNGRGRTPPLRIAGEPVQRGGGVRSPRPTANMETGRCGHRPLQVQDKECGESGRRGRRPLRVQDKECGESGRRGRRPYGCRTRSAVKRAVGDAGPYEALQVGRATARVAPTVGYCWCGGPGGGCAGAWIKQGEPGGSSCFVFCASLYSACFSASSRCGKTWPPFPGLHGRR